MDTYDGPCGKQTLDYDVDMTTDNILEKAKLFIFRNKHVCQIVTILTRLSLKKKYKSISYEKIAAAMGIIDWRSLYGAMRRIKTERNKIRFETAKANAYDSQLFLMPDRKVVTQAIAEPLDIQQKSTNQSQPSCDKCMEKETTVNIMQKTIEDLEAEVCRLKANQPKRANAKILNLKRKSNKNIRKRA